LTVPLAHVHTAGPMHSLRVLLALALFALPSSVSAAPVVYASVPDDGTDRGVAVLTPGSGSVSLGLYLEPGEFALEYIVSFEVSPGLMLESFVADNVAATVNFDGPGGTLSVTQSLGSGTADRVRIGSLVVLPTQAGGELRLADLPNAAFPALTDASFGLKAIPVPKTLALVPEPAALIPFGLSGLLALRRARGRRRTPR